ncbi:hypothetical protein [Streptomyces sp. BP-8]|uniref:Uncharacterized protein n=1 Tax=Streptomyces sirii TaxID=3127701 RepID=A0ABZ2QX85_9ACTN
MKTDIDKIRRVHAASAMLRPKSRSAICRTTTFQKYSWQTMAERPEPVS